MEQQQPPSRMDAFIDAIRSLHNIEGRQLPELTWGQQVDFVQNPVKYFIRADDDQQAAIWRVVTKSRFPQPQRRDGQEPCGECRLPVGETCDICGAKQAENTFAGIPLTDLARSSGVTGWHPGDDA